MAQRTYFRRRLFSRFLVEISQNDARACDGQRFSGLPAYPSRAARDDRDAAIETHQVPHIHHFTLRGAPPGWLGTPPPSTCAGLRGRGGALAPLGGVDREADRDDQDAPLKKN